MPSSHLILCHPLLLLPPIPPSIRVFSNESTLCMRWPKYWSFQLARLNSPFSLLLPTHKQQSHQLCHWRLMRSLSKAFNPATLSSLFALLILTCPLPPHHLLQEAFLDPTSSTSHCSEIDTSQPLPCGKQWLWTGHYRVLHLIWASQMRCGVTEVLDGPECQRNKLDFSREWWCLTDTFFAWATQSDAHIGTVPPVVRKKMKWRSVNKWCRMQWSYGATGTCVHHCGCVKGTLKSLTVSYIIKHKLPHDPAISTINIFSTEMKFSSTSLIWECSFIAAFS